MDVIKQIDSYAPFNEQESADKLFILDFLSKNPNAFLRENKFAHMTASAWIVNKKRNKALMAYHNIYKSWSWLGGHADGEKNLLKVALKEAFEESGISDIKPVSENIFSLEALTVDGHLKNEKYVSSHLHLNVTYLLEADENEALKIKPDENSGVNWFELTDAVNASSEQWFRENIYNKLNRKLILLSL